MAKIVTWIVLLFVIFSMMGATLDFSSASGNRTVMTIGDFRVSATMFDYFYYSTAYQYYSTFSQSGDASYYNLDITKPLEEQTSPYGDSWAEIFRKEAISVIETYLPLYFEASEKGYALDESELSDIDSSLGTLAAQATSYGVTQDHLLRTQYGPTITAEQFKSYLRIMKLVSRYVDDIISGYTFTDAEYEAAYQANSNAYDLAEFLFYSFSGNLPDDGTEHTEAEEDAYYREQKALAEEFVSKAVTPDAFFEQMLLYMDPEEGGNPEDQAHMIYALSALNADDAAFLSDPSRKEGDTIMREADGVFYIFLFIDRYRNEKNVDVRHILCSFDAEAADAEADKAAALKRAEGLLAQWKAGEATSESFGELAAENSDDSGSVSSGGLYTNITADLSYVWPFLKWCMQDHQPGDTGIVETVYGYHVMYFEKQNETAWKEAARPEMENARLQQHCDALVAEMPVLVDEAALENAMQPLKALPAAA